MADHQDEDKNGDGDDTTWRRFAETAEELLADGHLDAALTHAAAAYGLAEDTPRTHRGDAARVLASVHLALGAPRPARRYAAEARASFEAAGRLETLEAAEVTHVWALTYLADGDLETATPALEQSAATFERVGSPHALAGVLLTLAEVSLAMGEGDDAEGLLERVVRDVQAIDPEGEAHAEHLNALMGKAFLGLGSLAVQRGRRDEARDRLSRAITFFEAAHGLAHPETIEALDEVVALYRRLGDEVSAAGAAEERAIAERELAARDAFGPVGRA
ncbi:MAG: hypothetical protein AAF715_06035 [Myxococcota bacterium]